MIVAKPTWTRRLKQYRTIWWHEWHGVPYREDPRVVSGHVEAEDYRPNEFRACYYVQGHRTDIGAFVTLAEAQAAADGAVEKLLDVTLAEATASWKAWTKQRRAVARVEKLAREARLA